MDRELSRAELDELLPLHALDALDGDEREQVARFIERDAEARREVESLREAAAFLPPRDIAAPESLWAGIERSLGDGTAGPAPLPSVEASSARTVARASRRGRTMVALLATAAVIVAAALGVELWRQQDRIDELSAEMHRDPMEQAAIAARAATGAHVIPLADMRGAAGTTEVVMLPDGTGYLFAHQLPTLDGDRAYQLWAQVGEGASAQMISLGVLGSEPGVMAFRLAGPPTMFEVTREDSTGSQTPGSNVVVRGEVT